MLNHKLLCPALYTAMLLAPAVAFGGTRACVATVPSEASDSGSYQREAANLLDLLADRAAATVNDASELSAYQRANQISYWSQAFRLEAIRENVNGMGKTMCRLEEIRPALPPERRSEVRDLQNTLNSLANHTRFATRFAGNNQSYLWSPVYGQWVNTLYTEAQQLSHTLNRYDQYTRQHGVGGAAGQ